MCIRDRSVSQGEVLSVTTSKSKGILFFSGNDSNIFSVAKNKNTGKYSVLSKLRGQSHSVVSLYCLDYSLPNENNNNLLKHSSKLLSGGDTSDICVMDFDSFGFIQKTNSKKENSISQGFRHVLEPSENKLQNGFSKNMFLRRDNDFIEIVLSLIHI